MSIFDVKEFGAVGDGRKYDTNAIQAAAIACRDAGGGTVRVPAGTFLTGIIEIFSGTTLLVEKGGRLLASPRLEDHVIDTASVGLLFARDARDIVLTGEGTLDGNGQHFFEEGVLHGGGEDFSGYDTWQRRHGLRHGTNDAVHGPLKPKERPGNMVVFARCRKVRFEKLRVTGAAYWTIHFADCEDVVFENLTVDGDQRLPNNDGIHLTTCRRARIRNCRIACGDDAIALTGFREAAGEPQIAFGMSGLVGVCEDIEISDCVLTSRSAGIRIGYGQNPVRHVRISRVDILGSNRGIGIFARQADVEDVVVENCQIRTRLFHGNWWGRGEPIHLSAVRFPGEPKLHQIRDITFRDIEAIGENAVLLYAEEQGAIDGVKMTRVRSTLRRGELFENWGGNLELRPIEDQTRGIAVGGTAPLWAIGATDFHCENCEWILDEKAGPEFSAEPVIRDRP
ncbi:glycoside hydrolase family 28 protein [soil metagenome]